MSTAIFGLSLTQETFYVNRELQPDAWANGLGNLLLGMFSDNPSWLANLMMIPAWIVYKKPVPAMILAFCAFLIAFSFYFNGKITGNEAGHTEYATHYLIGYWLWLTSMLSYSVYQLIILLKGRKEINAL